MKVLSKVGSVNYPNLKVFSSVCFTSLKNDACLVSAGDDTDLSRKISNKTGLEPVEVDIHNFANKETYVNIKGNVSGKDVYLLPSDTGEPNEDLMRTLLRADAASRNGAKKVIAILPSYPYARQERRTEAGEANSAKLVADMLHTSGVDGVIVSDIHNVTIDGFSDRKMPIINTSSMPKIKEKLISEGLNKENLVIVSPDEGGIKRATALSKSMECDMAIICKTRSAHNVAQAKFIIGDVKGKNCVIYDDMIDTAGTIKAAVNMLKDNGADKVYVCATHGLFNGNAIKNLSEAPIEKVIISNSVSSEKRAPKNAEYIDISDIIVDEMKKITP